MEVNPYRTPVVGEPLEVELAREIGPADLALLGSLQSPDPPTSQGPAGQLVRLRDSHHQLARLLAGGMSNIEASSITGYSPGYISVLRKDPSFAELLAFYKQNLELAQGDVVFRLTGLNLSFIGELQDRLEANPSAMSNSFVLEAIKVLSDRTGHAPMTKSLNVNVNLAGRLESARRRAASAATPLIEGTLVPERVGEMGEVE